MIMYIQVSLNTLLRASVNIKIVYKTYDAIAKTPVNTNSKILFKMSTSLIQIISYINDIYIKKLSPSGDNCLIL